jgi:glycosyltransferase involved in cell wall biosynthesis
VWHDLPSAKVGKKNIYKGLDKILCVVFERSFLKMADELWVISFTEQKLLRRFYNYKSKIFNAVDYEVISRSRKIADNTWLLVGNWDRIENRSGAVAFFVAYADLVQGLNIHNQGSFTIAGNGSEAFLDILVKKENLTYTLKLRALANYSQLTEISCTALLAPIIEGAGIKIKILEAWSCNIPVIGTLQAFSGLPPGSRSLGGVNLESPYEMAKFCLDWKNAQKIIDDLEPSEAYTNYLDKILAVKN